MNFPFTRPRWIKLPRVRADWIPPSLMVMAAYIASRVLGIIRDMLFAAQFGAGAEIDAYRYAFRIPNMLTQIFVVGALSSTFLPIFIRYKEERAEKAWKLANVVFTLISAVVVIIGTFVVLFAPWIVSNLVARGKSAEEITMISTYLRILIASPLFLGWSAVLKGILDSHKDFLPGALAPVMYNIGIIFGTAFLVPQWGAIYGLSIGVVIGLILHSLVQFVPATRLGLRLQPDFDFSIEGVQEILTLALPRILGLAIVQVDMLVDANLASFLETGSLVMRDYAFQIQSMPVDIFGLALATTAFPLMASMAARQDAEGFYRILFKNLRQILYVTLPAAVVIIVLRVEIIRLIYGHGRLTWDQTRSVAYTLALFALSIGSQAVIYILVRAFYALKDTKLPVRASIISVVINSILSIVLVNLVGHVSMLALSFTIANFINMGLLIYFLQKKIGRLFQTELIASSSKVLLAAGVTGLVLWPLERWLSEVLNLELVRYLILETLVAGLVGIVVYLGMSLLLKCDELRWVVELAKDLKNRRARP